MKNPDPAHPSRRRVLLGVPAVVAAAALAARPAQAATAARPRVLECAADLLRAP